MSIARYNRKAHAQMKGFLMGLAGGLVGTALVVAALVLAGILPFQAVTTTVAKKGSSDNTQVAYRTTGLTPQQIYEQSADSVVEIVSTFPAQLDFFGQSSGQQQGIGSGFVVSADGYILTNAHVVSENGQLAGDVQVIFNKDGKQTTKVAGTIVGADDSTDVALIRVDPSQAPDLDPIPVSVPARGVRRD
jgi:S1-C subfamily serine protease